MQNKIMILKLKVIKTFFSLKFSRQAPQKQKIMTALQKSVLRCVHFLKEAKRFFWSFYFFAQSCANKYHAEQETLTKRAY